MTYLWYHVPVSGRASIWSQARRTTALLLICFAVSKVHFLCFDFRYCFTWLLHVVISCTPGPHDSPPNPFPDLQFFPFLHGSKDSPFLLEWLCIPLICWELGQCWITGGTKPTTHCKHALPNQWFDRRSDGGGTAEEGRSHSLLPSTHFPTYEAHHLENLERAPGDPGTGEQSRDLLSSHGLWCCSAGSQQLAG